jgi:hypothetical protein
MGVRAASLCLAALALLAGAVTVRASPLPVPIPGIAGPSIGFMSARRTADGGAVLLVRIPHRPGGSAGTTLTARVDAEGRLDLGYGYEGVARLHLGRGVVTTALAVDPATGDAWIGARNARRSIISRIDGTGHRQPGFGGRGVVTLPAVDDGGVRALAWRDGQLLIAAGARSGCAGCALTLLNAANGRLLARATVSPHAAGGPTCVGAVGVASVAFAGGEGLLVATSVAQPRGCAASLLELDHRLVPFGPSGPKAPPLPVQALRSVVITPEPGAMCAAGVGPAGTGMWPLGATRWTEVAAGASARLIAVVPLGAGGCGALVRRGPRSAVVTQSGSGGSAVTVTPIRAPLVPMAMFRCHEHLLVLGASGPAARETAVIVPVPITRGPFAASAAARSTSATGCG